MHIVNDRLKGIHYTYINKSLKRPTLIFLHGFLGDSSIWKDYIAEFKSNYNILNIDLLGHGKSFSPKFIDEYSFKNQSIIIKKIINSHNIKYIYLISYSYSTTLSFYILDLLNDKIEKVILISPYFKNDIGFCEKNLIKCLKKLWYFLAPNKKFELNYSKIKNYENPSFKDNKYILDSFNTKDIIGSYCSLCDSYNPSFFLKYDKPTLILCGENDKAALKHINKLNKMFFTLNLIKDKKHLFLKTKTNEVIKRLNEYFKEK